MLLIRSVVHVSLRVSLHKEQQCVSVALVNLFVLQQVVHKDIVTWSHIAEAFWSRYVPVEYSDIKAACCILRREAEERGTHMSRIS